jgi:hypothetical protein
LRRLFGVAALTAAGMTPDVASADSEDALGSNEVEVKRGSASAELRLRTLDLLTHRGAARIEIDPGLLGRPVDEWGALEPTLAAVLVGTSLSRAEPIDRIPILCEWATDPSLIRRRVLARALAFPFSCLGSTTAIELLARDPDPSVRTAARVAALLRFEDDPDRFAAVLNGSEGPCSS